ncbi:radical SAM protein [Methanothermobacter sp.]|uniref:radical SAM/SPASM domain-containing protein n=1 Tax=Methanothermobacter sp. TaxID=1884223 RepID=UPI00263A204D|nr:radical SAM protein [Methanothermobacter sp.]MDI9614585.1 radical SAM protein [Methanothermobacter sp.]
MVTKSCNITCKYCYMDSKSIDSKIEPLKPIMDIIELLETIKLEKLVLGGGEPFLRKDIFKILEDSVKRFCTSILTNGTMINKKIVEKLKYTGIDCISISLDSPHPTIHNQFRDNSFSDALESIKSCIKHGIDVDMGVCVHKKNFEYSIELIKMAEDLGLSSITFEGLNLIGRAEDRKYLQLEAQETDHFLEKVYEYLKDEKPDINVIMFYPQWVRWDSNAKGCEAAKSFFGILPNGEMVPCTNIPISLGNVLNKDFEVLWNSEIMNKIRNYRRGGCKICKYKDKCGGCRSRAYCTGDLLGSDPLCTLSHEKVI